MLFDDMFHPSETERSSADCCHYTGQQGVSILPDPVHRNTTFVDIAEFPVPAPQEGLANGGADQRKRMLPCGQVFTAHCRSPDCDHADSEQVRTFLDVLAGPTYTDGMVVNV
jgi:hypothetical protein